MTAEQLKESSNEVEEELETTIPSEEGELELIDARDVKQQICNIGIMAATLVNRQTIKLPKCFLMEKGAVYEA
jgi:hypothetical protein